ncbi:hypothetical protein HK107_09605 [Parvularcula sp. ZS-1/3]|uniref:Uncharacterized protein n=1 Tax=Parvularcula mediterranea TaxID=2732508 RepID=A0A7Y3RM18_9PROT|nr:hypothetical protein [Parvularcula mediterranea]NNU16574.1 hypothetical protein [Parvularcula mediterranea]
MISHLDYVRVRPEAEPRYEPGHEGSVVSVFVIPDQRVARSLGEKIGTRMIGVEADDGSVIEVPERFLDKLA